jgi:hypothetical protein
MESGDDASQRSKKRRQPKTQSMNSEYLKADVEGAGISKKKRKGRRDDVDVSRSQIDEADGTYLEDGTVIENQVEKMDEEVEKVQKVRKKKRQNQSLPLGEERSERRQTQGNLQITTDKSLKRQLPPAPAALARMKELGNASLDSPTRKREKQTKQQSRRRSSVAPQTEMDEFVGIPIQSALLVVVYGQLVGILFS